MEVDYTALVQTRPDLGPLAQKSSAILESQIGPPASTLRASWDVAQDDRGRTVIGLEISDWTGSVGYRFAPEELLEVNHMKIRLHRLWGDLLMIQSHSQLDHLNWIISTGSSQLATLQGWGLVRCPISRPLR